MRTNRISVVNVFSEHSETSCHQCYFYGGIPNTYCPPLPRLFPLGRGDVARAHAPPDWRRSQDRVVRGMGGGGREGPTRDAWPPPPPLAAHPGAGATRRWRRAEGASPSGGAGVPIPAALPRLDGMVAMPPGHARGPRASPRRPPRAAPSVARHRPRPRGGRLWRRRRGTERPHQATKKKKDGPSRRPFPFPILPPHPLSTSPSPPPSPPPTRHDKPRDQTKRPLQQNSGPTAPFHPPRQIPRWGGGKNEGRPHGSPTRPSRCPRRSPPPWSRPPCRPTPPPCRLLRAGRRAGA